MANKSRKLFVPTFTGKVSSNPDRYWGNPPPDFKVTSFTKNKTLQKVDQMLDSVSPGYKAEIINGATTAAYNYAANVINGKSKSGNPAKGSNNNQSPNPNYGLTVFKGEKSISDSNSSYALSKAPNPKEINLNSGIKPNTYSNDYMLPMENSCAPLHATCATLQIPTDATNPLNTYFLNTICFDIQTRAQANIGFNLDITTTLSSGNILAAYNAAIYALQVYFYYSSILSYESDPRNKNSGMIALRSNIDSQTLSDLAQLGRRLEDTPIPKRIVEWVRYMNGNFLSGNTQGSPLLKIAFSVACLTGSTTACSVALTGLTNYTTQFALIRKAIPSWKINTLYDCDPIPVYDKNFKTIFANLPGLARNSGNTANTRFNNVADANTAVAYNTYTNRLDGVAFAMSSMFSTANNCYLPGITQPTTVTSVFLDTKLSYYSVGGVKGFYYVVSYPFLQRSRQETSVYDGTTVYQPHLFGTDRCQNVTGSATLQTGQNTLDYLFNIGTIPYKGKISNFNNRANGKI